MKLSKFFNILFPKDKTPKLVEESKVLGYDSSALDCMNKIEHRMHNQITELALQLVQAEGKYRAYPKHIKRAYKIWLRKQQDHQPQTRSGQ